MEAVIPEAVYRQLEELHQQHHDLTGWFRTEDMADALGVSEKAARRTLRKMARQGQITSRMVSLNESQAHSMGLLGACGCRMYRLKRTDG